MLPDGDAMKYKTTESHFDWEKVCFGGFTGEMCRQKWQKVSSEVRWPKTTPLSHRCVDLKLFGFDGSTDPSLCFRSGSTEQ